MSREWEFGLTGRPTTEGASEYANTKAQDEHRLSDQMGSETEQRRTRLRELREVSVDSASTPEARNIAREQLLQEVLFSSVSILRESRHIQMNYYLALLNNIGGVQDARMQRFRENVQGGLGDVATVTEVTLDPRENSPVGDVTTGELSVSVTVTFPDNQTMTMVEKVGPYTYTETERVDILKLSAERSKS